jgi:hypothetical protein
VHYQKPGDAWTAADYAHVLPINCWCHPCYVTWFHGLLFAANVAQIRRERPQFVKCARNRAEIFALPIKSELTT